MRAINGLLKGLIDYAGLYPPAGLDMRTAVRNYLDYSRQKHAAALGRFVVDLNRLKEVREAAEDSLGEIGLSVVGALRNDWACLPQFIDDGFRIEMIEVKAGSAAEIEFVCKRLPPSVIIHFEIPINVQTSELIDAIAISGARAKLRMGGLDAAAFPTAKEIARSLKALADHSVSFKATAGLHHPVRSCHRFSYANGSDSGMMHGFVNLCCAASLLFFGGETGDAEMLLAEEDSAAWQVTNEAISWRSFQWSADQLHSVRLRFLTSFGSCSFEDPIHDLEALGWL